MCLQRCFCLTVDRKIIIFEEAARLLRCYRSRAAILSTRLRPIFTEAPGAPAAPVAGSKSPFISFEIPANGSLDVRYTDGLRDRPGDLTDHDSVLARSAPAPGADLRADYVRVEVTEFVGLRERGEGQRGHREALPDRMTLQPVDPEGVDWGGRVT